MAAAGSRPEPGCETRQRDTNRRSRRLRRCFGGNAQEPPERAHHTPLRPLAAPRQSWTRGKRPARAGGSKGARGSAAALPRRSAEGAESRWVWREAGLRAGHLPCPSGSATTVAGAVSRDLRGHGKVPREPCPAFTPQRKNTLYFTCRPFLKCICWKTGAAEMQRRAARFESGYPLTKISFSVDSRGNIKSHYPSNLEVRGRMRKRDCVKSSAFLLFPHFLRCQ